MTSSWKQLKVVGILALGGVLLGSDSRGPAQAQELEKETLESIVGATDDRLQHIAKTLSLEIRVLQEMQQRILEEGQRLRLESMDQLQKVSSSVEKVETPLITSTELETNSQLISNCLSELQRIEWEEATEESAVVEGATSTVPPEFERERQKLRSAIDIAKGELAHLHEKGTRLKELFERNSVSSEAYQDHVAKMRQSEVVLKGLMRELEIIDESVHAAARAPIVAAKHSLAQLRARKAIVLKQLKQLQARQADLKEARFKEQSLGRLIDQAYRLSENDLPMRIKLIQSEVMRQAIERELVSRKQAAEKADRKE